MTDEIASREVHIRFFWFTWRQTVMMKAMYECEYGIMVERQ